MREWKGQKPYKFGSVSGLLFALVIYGLVGLALVHIEEHYPILIYIAAGLIFLIFWFIIPHIN